jgi:hypothetical protein
MNFENIKINGIELASELAEDDTYNYFLKHFIKNILCTILMEILGTQMKLKSILMLDMTII